MITKFVEGVMFNGRMEVEERRLYFSHQVWLIKVPMIVDEGEIDISKLK